MRSLEKFRYEKNHQNNKQTILNNNKIFKEQRLQIYSNYNKWKQFLNIRTSILVLSINVNGFNSLIKAKTMLNLVHSVGPLYILWKSSCLNKGIQKNKIKKQNTINPANRSSKKAREKILIPHKQKASQAALNMTKSSKWLLKTRIHNHQKHLGIQ